MEYLDYTSLRYELQMRHPSIRDPLPGRQLDQFPHRKNVALQNSFRSASLCAHEVVCYALPRRRLGQVDPHEMLQRLPLQEIIVLRNRLSLEIPALPNSSQ